MDAYCFSIQKIQKTTVIATLNKDLYEKSALTFKRGPQQTQSRGGPMENFYEFGREHQVWEPVSFPSRGRDPGTNSRDGE